MYLCIARFMRLTKVEVSMHLISLFWTVSLQIALPTNSTSTTTARLRTFQLEPRSSSEVRNKQARNKTRARRAERLRWCDRTRASSRVASKREEEERTTGRQAWVPRKSPIPGLARSIEYCVRGRIRGLPCVPLVTWSRPSCAVNTTARFGQDPISTEARALLAQAITGTIAMVSDQQC